MDKEGKKGVNQGFSIVKALLLTKTVSDKRDICAIMDRSSVYKHVIAHKKMKHEHYSTWEWI